MYNAGNHNHQPKAKVSWHPSLHRLKQESGVCLHKGENLEKNEFMEQKIFASGREENPPGNGNPGHPLLCYEYFLVTNFSLQ